MYRTKPAHVSNMTGVESYIAESLEHKVKRILNNKEPIKDGAPLIYTERKDGVLPSYNIKTDRWEHAIDAMDKVTKHKQAKREERAKIVQMKEQKPNETGGHSINETGGQSIDGLPGTL